MRLALVDWLKNEVFSTFKHNKTLIVALLLIGITGIYPPWIAKWCANSNINLNVTKDLGYQFIGNPPTTETVSERYETTGTIDIQRLLVEWGVIIILAGGLLYSTKNRAK